MRVGTWIVEYHDAIRDRDIVEQLHGSEQTLVNYCISLEKVSTNLDVKGYHLETRRVMAYPRGEAATEKAE